MSKSKKPYVRTYRKEWEDETVFSGWLKACIGEDTKAWCKACKCTLKAHKKDLVEHSKTKKHEQSIKRSVVVGHSSKMSDHFKPPIQESRKIAELKIAAYAAEHSSMRAVDHLGVLLKKLDPASAILRDIKLHRTKCTALIKNVIAPCFLQELLEEVGDSHYSIIIDESTAVDTKKIMCMILRFFSQKQNKIVTQLYRLIEIDAADATSLTTAFKTQLIADGLTLDKLLGIGVDGANVMIGEHHSFSSILKDHNPELVTVKCVCHSLHLAAEYAFKTLPRFLDFLIKESHNWFSNSTKRQSEYKEIYALLSDGKKPLKINKFAGTRWLSRYEALTKILEQWDALTIHFDTAKNKERCYIADHLSSILKSKTNLLYMGFLGTYLKPITNVNKMFQASNADPLKLLEEINNLLYTYLTVLVPPTQLEKTTKQCLSDFQFKKHTMDPSYMNFGHTFNEQSQGIRENDIIEVKKRCKDFLVEICKEIQKRLPNNMKILESCKLMSPKNATSQVKPDITNLAKSFKSVCGNVDYAVQEWNSLHRTMWTCTDQTEGFWIEVYNMKNAVGESCYRHIAKLAIGILSLPFSNAIVERAFSQVNIIKDKLRNRMAIETAEAVLRIRYSLPFGCINFEPTSEMLKMFNSENVYTLNKTEKNESECENNCLIIVEAMEEFE